MLKTFALPLWLSLYSLPTDITLCELMSLLSAPFLMPSMWSRAIQNLLDARRGGLMNTNHPLAGIRLSGPISDRNQ